MLVMSEHKGPVADHQHSSVMIQEMMDIIQPEPDGTYVDATLGMGGHAKVLLSRLGSKGRLIGIDKDKSSLEIAKENLSEFDHHQISLLHNLSCRIYAFE